MNIEAIRNKHKLLMQYDYEKKNLHRGYTGKTLYINLSKNMVKEKDVTEEMKDKFIGGKGFGLKYLWDAVTPETKWHSPENEIIISSGPIGGITQYPGAGKSLVVTLSPLTDMPIDSNVGGYFGPYLKFSGWDALEIQGKAENDVIVFIDGNKGVVTIEEAPLEAVDAHVLTEQLTEMYGLDDEDKKHISVISAGTAAENSLIGILNFSFHDVRRNVSRLKQAGRGGIGTVFRDKKIKAIVISYRGITGDLNQPADLGKIQKAGLRLHKEMACLDKEQNEMRMVGTCNIIDVMADYDLLPVHNFKFGTHPDAKNISTKVFRNKYFTQGIPDGCWYGCSMACAKAVDQFEIKTGPYRGQVVTVDGPEYENAAGLGANCGIFDPEIIIELNFYCDTYGIDTISFGTMTAFIMECFENGIIDEKVTDGMELKFGNGLAALELIHKISKGEGFGKIAGQGTKKMKALFVKNYGADESFLNDIGMEQKGLEYSEYVSKESLAQQGGYGLTNKGPQHDEAWLIFMDMVNNQIPTFEDKAEALHYFPMFRTWFGLMGLCKLPWNDVTPADNSQTDEPAKVPGHVQNYVEIFEGVTGKKIDKDELIRQSERVYNFQRVFNIRMGKGLRTHDQVPYRSVGPVTEEEYLSRQERYDKQLKELLGLDPKDYETKEKVQRMRTYRTDQYEQLIDAVYARRGWTHNGIPSKEKLEELGMDLPEVIAVVEKAMLDLK